MKARLLALLIGLLLLAMIPALVMAQGQARPDRTFQFRMNAANPRPPQLAAPKPGSHLHSAQRHLRLAERGLREPLAER